jgi:hypothetical protein
MSDAIAKLSEGQDGAQVEADQAVREVKKQSPMADTDRMRLAAKQTAKGVWSFEITVETPFRREMGTHAGAIIQNRENVKNKQLDEGERLAAIREAIDNVLAERAELMGIAVAAMRKQFADRGWQVV